MNTPRLRCALAFPLAGGDTSGLAEPVPRYLWKGQSDLPHRLMEKHMQRIQIIDSHTGGEPTRLVIGGFPDLGTGTMA